MILRRAGAGDVRAATKLMQAAFAMWEPIGFDASSLSESVVRSFFVQDGYVAEDAQARIVAVVCLSIRQPRVSGREMHVARAHREDKTILLDLSLAELISGKKCAYFYSLAVDPRFAKGGIGRKCLELLEEEASRHGCDGLLLETRERGAWLVDWYRRVGFEVVGKYERNEQPLVFMLKDLAIRRKPTL